MTMRKLAVLIFICLSISRSLQKEQKKSKFYNLLNTFASFILVSQANLHGHARLPVACSVFCHLWRGVGPSHTRHAPPQTPKTLAGVLPMHTGLKEENLVGVVEIMDGISVPQKMPMRSSRKMSHLAANMVREGLTNNLKTTPRVRIPN